MKIGTMFKQKTVVGILTAVIFTIIGFTLAKNTLAMPPSAVTLISFIVTSQDNAALLEWETATEFGTAGFTIFRKGTTGDFADISGFLNAEGDGAAGAEYNYLDETAVNGQTYTYQLTEIETNSTINTLETITLTIGVQATATPITVGGGSSNTATQTATTSAATATTPAATATTRSASDPTATPQPTTASATTAPTRATTTNNDPTATSTPIAVASSSDETNDDDRDSSTVFAQGNTPIPTSTTDAYPDSATGNDDNTSAAVSTSYPANDEQVTITADTTATPYPAIAIEETTSIDNNGYTDNDGVNVIGSGSTANSSESTAADNDSSTGYLWIGFLLALAVFIAGLVGTAVLFIRKK